MQFYHFSVLLYTISYSVEALEQVICEQKLGFINCPIGRQIQINSVLYGRTQQSLCNQFLSPISNLNCKSGSVSTNSVIAACQGRSACLLMADTQHMGEDPCPSVPKYLQIFYQCVTRIQSISSSPTSNPTSSSSTTTRPTTTTSQTTTTRPTTTKFTTQSTTPTTSSSTIKTTTKLLTTPTTQTSSSTSSKSTPTSMSTASTAVSHAPKTTKDNLSCHDYLISGPRGIPDARISASSILSLSNNAHRARLYLEIQKYSNGFMLEGGWTANTTDKQPYIEVELNWLAIIQGVVTQGRHVNPDTGCCQEWTTKYTVHYSADGQKWETVKENNADKIFIGNTDSDTIVTHMFDCPVAARFVRLEVKDYVSRPSLRLELIGCPTNTDDIGRCPKGWNERPGSNTCYYISDQSDQKTWENADIMCKRHQGNIVKVDSVQERDWLIQELQNIQKSQKLQTWWLGLNNRPRFDNNFYKWGDGTPLDTNVLQWLPSEPNNSGGVEHCATYLASRAALNDLNCDTTLPFICEMSKFWQPPVNTPGLQTRQPTVPSTMAPSTVPNLVPVPVTGGNVVTVGQTVFYTGCLSLGDCSTHPWGDYPSCHGCHFYLTCAPSGVFDRACPQNLKYDANLQACSTTSSTCRGP